MAKAEHKVIKSENKGLNSLILNLMAYAVTAIGIILTHGGPSKIEYINYLSWISYPIFAFLIAVGFDETSSKFRYFLRLLLFAALSEIPYDYLKTGSIFSIDGQNGMFTLCLGYLVLWVIWYIDKKTKNIVLCGVVMYGLGLGLYWVSRYFDFECYSFGIMFIVMFYLSRHCKYPRLLQIGFIAFLVLVVSSENSLTFIIGDIQYSMPFRAYSLVSVILVWLYNEKQGPNKLWLTISQYCFYPVILGVACILEYLV